LSNPASLMNPPLLLLAEAACLLLVTQAAVRGTGLGSRRLHPRAPHYGERHGRNSLLLGERNASQVNSLLESRGEVKVKSAERTASKQMHLAQGLALRTQDTYVCATLDWWPPSKCDYGICPWEQRGILNLDLNSPKLRVAVSALAPLLIRVGGSMTDTITYDPNGTGEGCGSFVNTNSTVLGFDLHGPCLTGQRWSQILDFCSDLGCKLVLDVNAMRGRQMEQCPVGTDCFHNREAACCQTVFGVWNSSNARQLFEFTRMWQDSRGAKADPLVGFEFGNELLGHGIQAHIRPEVYGADFNQFASVIREVWPEETKRPRMIGPGSTFEPIPFAQFLAITRGNLDIITHHFYNLGAGKDVEAFQHATNLDNLEYVPRVTDAIVQAVQANAPGVEVWVGEAGGAYNSGRNHTTNAFVSGFWYNDAMATASLHGSKAFCRQTLTGGMYGLIDTTTLEPNPDFYSAFLWRSLMGPEVLQLGGLATNRTLLRSYAHCTHHSSTGGVTLLMLNLDHHHEATVGTLDSVFGRKTRKKLYILTSPSLDSSSVLINGVPMSGVPKDIYGVPDVELNPGETLNLPLLSQAFVVVPEAQWPACSLQAPNSVKELTAHASGALRSST